ncbi:MAG: hypothetical protein Q9178_004201 [Gyalolechia marmorata]
MIERVAACLENGGKHVLQRISKQPFRTRRSLHFAFWSHGAGNIDLPSWWLAFLQVPSSCDQTWSSTESTINTPRALPDGIGLLDFLYPGETLAFIRKFMNGNASAIKRRRRSQLLSQRLRTYTSAADSSVDLPPSQKDAAQGNSPEDKAGDDKNQNQLDAEAESALYAKFRGLLRAEGQPRNGEELWKTYQETQRTSLSLDPRDVTLLFKRLSTSKIPFDLECTRILLNDIPLPNRNALHYDHAISAALELGNLGGAMNLHREATQRIRYLQGSSMILKYALQHSKWGYAEEIWKYRLDKKQAHVGQPDLWEGLNSMPTTELMMKAVKAVDCAIRRAKTSTFDDAEIMRSLAISLVQRALSTRKTDFSVTSQVRMLRMSRRIHEADLTLYKAAVLQNISVGRQSLEHNNMALKLYREIKGKLNLVPDLSLLKTMLKRFSALRDSQGMYEVLEDYRKYHGAPPMEAYPLLMAQLARHGDFDTVEELFQDFIDKYGSGEIQNHARTLLFTCLRRAEADRANTVLQSLREAFGYEPDLEAWNILIAIYARVGDYDGATAIFDKLMAANITPENSTYGILMGMFAKRSDPDTTSALYEQAISTGIKPNVAMVDSLVLALITCDRFDEAYQIVQEALTMDLDKAKRQSQYIAEDVTRTRMWNTLLSHCAMNKRLDKVAEIQKRMHEAGVPFDDVTYAALMLSLCVKNMPGAALRIKNVIMRSHGIRPTTLHYSILMGGFMETKEPNKVLLLANEMLENKISPTFSSQNQLLRVASKIDEQEDDQVNPGDGPFQARRAEAVMRQALETLNPMELAALGPTQRAQSNPVNVAFYSSYFSYMIYLYGKKHSFARVVDLYDEYISTARKVHGGVEGIAPVELLSALMVTHFNAGEHAETEKCWQLAMEKSEKLARKVDADTSQPGWVLYKYRFILSLPLTRYMQSLQAMSRVDDIATTVDNLQHAGYQLSVHNWNKYTQTLAQEGRALLAFEICEKHLIQGWPGWEHFGNSIRAKYKIKKQWNPKRLDRGRPFPHYETFVYLARAYLDAKSLPYGTGTRTLQDLERLAPRTMEAVLKMPKFDDGYQNNLLRRSE